MEEALGEAFQLRDDLIDAFDDGTMSGKPAGLDFKQRKMTVLLSLAVHYDSRLWSLVEDGELFDLLRERLMHLGIHDKVEASSSNEASVRSARLHCPQPGNTSCPGWQWTSPTESS